MKTIVKIIITVLGWLFKKENKTTKTENPEGIYKKTSDVLKVVCLKENDEDIYRVILGKSIAINKKFKTSNEAYKWIKGVNNNMLELSMTIAKEIYGVEKSKERKENIHKIPKSNKA